MLNRVEASTLPREPDQSVRVSGRQLKHVLRRASPAQKAKMAADMIAGHLVPERLTRAQAKALSGGSQTYIHVACRLSPMERQQVNCGVLTLSDVARRSRVPTNRQIDELVHKVGAQRFYDALDRITKPITA
jgi:hypothetical protein